MQQLIITGSIGDDAVTRNVNQQRDVINFNVACNEKWRDAQGVEQSRTTWYNCSYFVQTGKTAIAAYLKKGTKVLVVGKPSARAYTNAKGETVGNLDVAVQSVELMGSAPTGQAQAAAQPQPVPQQQPTQPQAPVYQQPTTMMVGGQAAPTNMDDDLPF
jgi:single-strand DNA-binding protein